LFEALTWTQIGVHRKPVGLLNTSGYFDLLLAWIERAKQDNFIFPEHLQLFTVSADPDTLLAQLAAFSFPEGLERWVDREG
jgi:predicted Rossmann-fold nucleotide-binding protein